MCSRTERLAARTTAGTLRALAHLCTSYDKFTGEGALAFATGWFMAREFVWRLTQRAQMKWEVKGVKENDDKVTGREQKNSNTSPPLLQSCIKALTRVV